MKSNAIDMRFFLGMVGPGDEHHLVVLGGKVTSKGACN